MCESKAFFYKFPSIHLAKPCLESVFTINFTLESKERVKKLKKKEKQKYKVPKTAQDIVHVDVIHKDGIFQVGNKYTKTYRFSDINYAIASKEEKEGMFLNYSELLNSLDSSTVTKITINYR